MTTLLISLALLIGGYFIYGAIAERIFGTDPKRPTPATTMADGIDYIAMPTWKVFLIQFLNIAGMGPIFGAIMGIMFGPAALLWIVFGTIFAGAVHDFIGAMMSMREGGVSLPEIVGRELGGGVKHVMRVFSLILLILVGTVFVISPAEILASLTPESLDKIFWVGIILIYYILATMLPIDKLIGNLYPVFGVLLLFMALGLLGMMLFGGVEIPVGFGDGLQSRHGSGLAVFPMVCVSIACGAISGFHATQSPLMARCLKNERYARPVFYGAMVTEGIVALVWACATIAFTGGYDGLNSYMADGGSASTMVKDISLGWFGKVGGIIAIIGVIAAPISSGDTAFRSARLIIADLAGLSQRKFFKRLALTLPLFAIAIGLMMVDYNVLWRYFAWSNQTLAMFTLWAATVWLARRGRSYVITLLPALFMTVVCTSYLLFAPEGFGLPQTISVAAGVVVALGLLVVFARRRRGLAPAPEN